MFEATVYTAITGEAHEVNVLAALLSIGEGTHEFLVLTDATVGTGAVNLHEVLIYNASGTDVEVSDFAVTHLSVGQTNVLTTGLKLTVRIGSVEIIEIGCRSVPDDIAHTAVANSPTIKNYE
jgi:hypothetical protein